MRRRASEIWTYDPKVPGNAASTRAATSSIAASRRGTARSIVGTLDGRLVALDAATGKPVWEVMTVDKGSRYTITGAPRVVKGKVLIGNGGAEIGVRGYVSAYDAETGKIALALLHRAGRSGERRSRRRRSRRPRQTWTGEWWKLGGGGTVWDSIVVRPGARSRLHRHRQRLALESRDSQPGRRRQPVLSSIVALKADTGEYVWHYQTTPGETLGLHGDAAT